MNICQMGRKKKKPEKKTKNNASQERQTFPASQKPWRVETKTNRENKKP